MEIQILLAGVEFGPYSDDKARELIAEGFLNANDPAKRLDEREWLPLTEVLAQEPAAPPADEGPATDDLSAFGEEEPASATVPEESAATAAPEESENASFVPDEPEAFEPALTEEEPEPVPALTVTRPAHVKRSASQPAPFFNPSTPRTQAISGQPPAPDFPDAAADIATIPPAAPPLLNVAVPSRGKTKVTGRTGSLLVKEALQAARASLGASPATVTAPLPRRPEPPRPVRDPEPPAVPVAQPPAEKTAPAAAPPTKPRSRIVLKTGDLPGTPAPKARRTIKLTQPISLGTVAPPVAPEPAAPSPAKPARLSPQAPEPPSTTGKIRLSQITRTMPLRVERKTISIEAQAPVAPSLPIEEKRPATQPLAEPEEFPAPVTEAIEMPEPTPETLPPISDSTALPDPSLLTASGDLAEKRSLKITGALKQPTARIPVRLTPTFPYKPGDSGKTGLRTEEKIDRPPSQPMPGGKKIWGPESPASRPFFPSTAKISPPAIPLEPPRLDTRPPSTKIPVSEMPPEGLKVRSTRRLTGRIPIPGLPKPPELPAPVPVETPPVEASEPVTPVEAFAPVETIETPPAIEPPAETEVEIAEALAPAPDLAKPEKVRLRRPVKLELSSRTKADSGRITLEDFSKMTTVDVPPRIIPPLPRQEPGEETETREPSPRPGGEMMQSDTTLLTPAETGMVAETVPLAPLDEIKPPRLSEIRILRKAAPTPHTPKQKWIWIAYAIIAVGMLAFLLLLYLANFRRPAAPSTGTPVSSLAPTPAPPSTPAPASGTAQTPPAAAPAPPVNSQVNAYIAAGEDSFKKGNLDDALSAFNHALDLDPKSADALYNRGLTKAQQDDSDGAIADFSQVLEIDPKMGTAYYARGLARHSKGDLDGALNDYNLAVQADPKQPMAFFNRGLIRMQKDDIDGAIVDSGRVVELDPNNAQAYYNRGLGRLAKGALDAALSDMTTFCTLAPQEAFTDYAHLYIWLIRTQQNQLAEANQQLTQAMNSGWNASADAMVTKIGEFLLGQISEDELIAAAASPVPLTEQGQHCEAWYFIGMRRLESGDKDGAAIDLRKCVETQKTDYCEYILAQEQLKTLNPAEPVTSK